jgi:hypothetical protein
VALTEDAPAEAIRAVASIKRDKIVTRTKSGDVITTYKSEYKFWDKLMAINLLGKKLRLWIDRVETEGAQDQLYKELLKSLKEEKQEMTRGFR